MRQYYPFNQDSMQNALNRAVGLGLFTKGNGEIVADHQDRSSRFHFGVIVLLAEYLSAITRHTYPGELITHIPTSLKPNLS